DDDEQRAGDSRGGDGDSERELLHAHRVDAHQMQRDLVLSDGEDGAAEEGAREEDLQAHRHGQRDDEGDEEPERQVDRAEAPGGSDVPGIHRSVIDAEGEDERDLGDEEDAEEEGEAAERLASPSLEACMVEAIEDG